MKSAVSYGIAAVALLYISCASTANPHAKKLFECSDKVQDAVNKYQKHY